MSMKFKLPLLSGVLGVLLLWVGVSIGAYRSGLSLTDSRPLSYIGVSTESALLFNAALLVSAVLFSVYGIFLYKWFKLSRFFLTIFLIGQFSQVVAAIIPYGGTYKIIHTYAAFTLAGCIPLYILLFVLSKNLKSFKRTAKTLFIAEVVCFIIGIGTFVFIKKVSPLAEILPALPFHAWIVLSTIYIYKRR